MAFQSVFGYECSSPFAKWQGDYASHVMGEVVKIDEEQDI